MDVFDLYAKISLDVSDYKKGLAEAGKSTEDAKKSIGGMTTPIGKVLNAFNAVTHPVQSMKTALDGAKEKAQAFIHPIQTIKGRISEASSALETNRNKLAVASAAYDKAQKSVKDLTTEFNKSAKENGAASEKTQDLAKALQEAVEKAEAAKKELDGYSDTTEKAGKESEEAGKKVDSFGSKLGAALSGAAKIGAAAIGAVSAAIVALGKSSIEGFSEYEQLAGGIDKIFDQMDSGAIFRDAQDAWKNLNMNANDYLATIVDVGANFASTMGDEKGYETAKRGFQAISDYSSGTGKNVDELAQKFTMITRAASGYQSIADQFSGILPATSQDFLEQAQAAGFLSDSYKSLTEVPIAEYQESVALMLEKGVENLGLTGNTAAETATTISGSLAATKAAWQNLVVGFADSNADLDALTENLITSVETVAKNLVPLITGMLPRLTNGLVMLTQGLLPQIPGLLGQLLPALISGAESLLNGVAVVLPELLQLVLDNTPALVEAAVSIVGTLGAALLDSAPMLLESGGEILDFLASGISSAIVLVAQEAPKIIQKFLQFLTQKMPDVVAKGTEILSSIISGITAALPLLIASLPLLVESITQFLLDNGPLLIESGVELIVQLAVGIIDAIPTLLETVPKLISSLVESFGSLASSLWTVGRDAISSLLNGISSAWAGLGKWIADAWEKLWSGLDLSWIDKILKVFESANPGASSSDLPTLGPIPKHASGLDYVPYDGYTAELHRGETVLTRYEAEKRRSGSDSEVAELLGMILEAIESNNQQEIVLKVGNREFGRAVRGSMGV